MDLDKKYRELFSDVSTIKTKEPEAKTEEASDLDTKYQQLFGSEKPKEEERSDLSSLLSLEDKVNFGIPTGEEISAYEGPEIVDRQKAPVWKRVTKTLLPKKVEGWFGLDKPEPEKETYQKIVEHEELMENYYGTGTDLLGGIKTFGKGLKLLPIATAVAILQASQGLDGPDVLDPDWADRFINDASEDLNKFVYETQLKYKDKHFISGLPLKITALSELPQNIAFSLTSMGAGLATGIPISATAPYTGAGAPLVIKLAWGTGTFASGQAAYNMSTYSIMDTYLNVKNEETIAEKGREMTREEQEKYRDSFESDARKYGLWEAIPEAASNLAFGKIITKPFTKVLTKMGLKNSIVAEMILKLTTL